MKRVLLLLVLFSQVLFAAPAPVFIDVRTPAEYVSGHLAGALNLEHETIEQTIARAVPKKDTPIVLYCRSGRRSGIALEKLRNLGYSQLTNGGGFEALKARAFN